MAWLSRFPWRFIIILAIIAMGIGLVFTGRITLPGKVTSGLQVITNDATASLFLDGQYLDKTPFIGKNIKPGTYSLKIQPDNQSLVAHETNVTLRQGLLTVVTWKPGDRPETSGGVVYEMEPLKGTRKAELSFVTIPDTAIIKFDEREQSFSPLIISDLEPGHHQFEVTLPSYETQRHTINAIAGHRITITVKLAKSSGEPAADSSGTTGTSVSSPSPTPTTTSTTSAASTPSARLQNPSLQNTSGSPSPTGRLVTITSTNFYQNGKEVLRVRDSASNAGKELGLAEVGKQYPYLNESTNGWHKITFNNQAGWVSAQYSTVSP